ncbi:MAG: hypothetical protein DRO01_08250, partial [Thermoproteota archaeon]
MVLLSDNDANGYVTFGDIIRISCDATYAGVGWEDAPNVNLSGIGLSPNFYLTRVGTSSTYSSDILLNMWRPTTPNFTLRNFNVQAFAGTADNEWTNSIYCDIVQVDGVNAIVSPATINQTSNIVIRIDDNSYQNSPNGGTVATVDLSPIGGSSNTTLTYIGGNRFQFSQTPPAGLAYSGNLTMTLKDPFHPAKTYQTNTFVIDTIPSFTDVGGTTVQIMSGNAIALPGDVLRFTAKVTAFDNDTVTVQNTSLTNPPASPSIAAASSMTLTQSNGLNQPAAWQTDVVLSEFSLQNTSLPITFTFTDKSGNVSVLTKYISIDLVLAPTIVNKFPNADTSNNHPNSAITLEFSRAMDPSTLNISNITVASGASNISGTITIDPTNTIATFTPDSDLPYNALITVSVSAGVKDVGGVALATSQTYAFSTIMMPEIQWQKCFGGTGQDQGFDIALSQDGGYVFTGLNFNGNPGSHGMVDGLAIKSDGNGNLQWEQCFGGADVEVFEDVKSTTDGGCVACGQTNSTDGDVSGNHGGNDAWVVKIDVNGNLQWQKCFGGSGGENFSSI